MVSSKKKVKLDHSPSKSSPLKSVTTTANQQESDSEESEEEEIEVGRRRVQSEREEVDSSDEDDHHEEEEEDEDEDEDDTNEFIRKVSRAKGEEKELSERELNQLVFNKQFLTGSTGDKYLLSQSQPTGGKTSSNNLLSNSIETSFTLNNFYSNLSTYDKLNPTIPSTSTQDYSKKFPKWSHELTSQFNLLFYGFGSKITPLNEFGEYLRSKVGNVIVINGYDEVITLSDILQAIESLVTSALLIQSQQELAEEDEEEEVVGGRNKRKRTPPPASTSTTPKPKPLQLSALESRIRRLSQSLSLLSHPSSSFKDIYLIIHSLDSPSLRSNKTLNLLALLSSQPKIHLIGSVDHLRSCLLFSTTLASSRPPFSSSNSNSNSPPAISEIRSFTFLYHDLTTLHPYTLELSHSSLLSSLLPPSIYPPSSSSSSSQSSTSILKSLTYILLSVTSKSKKLFSLLISLQLSLFSSLPSSISRSLLLNPPISSNNQTPIQAPAPIIATNLKKFQDLALDRLIVSNLDQVNGLLSEFRDHGILRFSEIGPDFSSHSLVVGGEREGEGAGAGEGQGGGEGEGGEWIWIALGKEGLEEVMEGLEG